MSEIGVPNSDEQQASGSSIFGGGPQEKTGFPVAAWGVAALIVLVVAGALLLAGRKKAAVPANTLLPADAYAASLPLSQMAMSESSNLSGGKLTYLDGSVQNTGGRVVTGVTVQVSFGNDEALPPQIETLPLSLIRMREPYIDTEPVSAEPIKPGETKDFRLIFEQIPSNWNTQLPDVRIIRVNAK